MPQTRMFRDRMVSMEQTLERGEKNLEFLKRICKQAFPEFEYREHFLDHERDLFVMGLEAPDGRRRTVCWTRMVLFDAERLPALVENPDSPLASKMTSYLRERASRPEIIVTFRHLEEGWVETPAPRREKRRGRRGRGDSRGRREEKRGAPPAPADRVPGQPPPPALPGRDRAPAGEGSARPPGAPSAEAGRRPGGRRRRFRRRRGRGGRGGTGNTPTRPPQSP